MPRMTGQDYAVMCNLIITYTHTHTWAGTGMGVETPCEKRGRLKVERGENVDKK